MQFANKFCLATLVAVGGTLLANSVFAETWSDATGKFKIEAKFLGVQQGQVALEKSDGSRIQVPFAKLSAESQALARQKYAEMKAGGANAPANAAGATGVASNGSKLSANPSAEETVEVLTAAMADIDMDTLWDMFPKRYQADIDELIQTAAKNIQPQVWNGFAGVLKKVSQLASTKRDFILNNSTVSGFVPNTPETIANWDATAKLLNAVASSSLTDNRKMQNFSMAGFLKTDGPKIKAAAQEISQLAAKGADNGVGGPAPALNGSPPSFQLISASDHTAEVEVTQNGTTHNETFVKVDNRWVPKEMADEWDEKMSEARQELAKLSTPEGQQNMQGVMMFLPMVTTPLDQMLAASSQSEFDQIVDPLVQQFGMMIPMMMGGGPGGPPGFGGPPGAGPPGGGFGGGDFGGGDFGADAFGEAPAN